jgi:AraC-like DNA-binding protein
MPKIIAPGSTSRETFRSRTGRITTTASQQARAKKILNTVRAGSLCTIHDLAVEFNLSTSHLQHLFKAQTGSSLGRSLTEERLRKAALLLLDSDMSVKEIADMVGYKHPSSFIRAFNRYFQRAPSCYRQEMLIERSFG